MNDTPSHGPVKYIMPKWVRGPQDFVGGIALIAIAVFALWASSDLQGMHGFSFGAGTAPRMFAVLLLGLVISAFASFLIAALGTPETRWRETIIVGICLTIGCSLLFPYALGLPLQLFPRFLIQ